MSNHDLQLPEHSGALSGDLIAGQGIGGLGHLGVQFANKFGYKVAAIGRGAENVTLAKKLGASVYIDSQSVNAAQELQKLGGELPNAGLGPFIPGWVFTLIAGDKYDFEAHHTGGDVVIWSQGPGSEALGRAIDNTFVYEVVKNALKL
ncbi:MAG TPA: zinc-binding dehydrogenase [Terriglobales bacterium]|nr:zinc-binding dehydrogenase [Terriglobales bacterium]